MTTSAPALDPSTLRSLLLATVTAHPERPALTYRRGGDGVDWQTLTWHEFATVVLQVVAGLPDLVGDASTVAILADTDARYPVLELALGLSGRTVQPLYVSAPDDELRRAVQTTGAGALVVDEACRDRAVQVSQGIAEHLRVVGLASAVPLPGLDGVRLGVLGDDVEPFDTTLVRERLAALPARSSGRPLLFLQSTGTTGPAKVMEVAESALLASVEAVRGETALFPRFLSFLPTAHISERLLTLYASVALAGNTWYGDGLTTLETDLAACRPTVFLTPPMLLEVIRDQAVAAAGATRLGRQLLAAVQKTADAALARGRSGGTRRGLPARLFGRKLRRATGLDAVRDAFVGTAPAPAELLAWFEAVGLPLRNVYGQTEVAGAVSISERSGAAFDGVGKPVEGVEIAIGAGDELLVRTASAFTQYLGASAPALDGAGWVHSGDRARLTEDGEIVLLGRTQSLVQAPDGTSVDVGVVLGRVLAELDLPVGVVHSTPAGSSLYLAAESLPSEPAADDPLPPVRGDDPRWGRLSAALHEHDPHGAIGEAALLDGAFRQATGELGPTGKPRGWRIHELYADHLRRISPRVPSLRVPSPRVPRVPSPRVPSAPPRGDQCGSSSP